jgi:hypothetical protein
MSKPRLGMLVSDEPVPTKFLVEPPDLSATRGRKSIESLKRGGIAL